MKCPHCGHPDDKVIDSRTTRDGAAIRRRRKCLQCGERFTTYEYVEIAPLAVMKADGRSEPFDRAKLRKGVATALAKRPVPAGEVDKLVSEVEELCHNLGSREVRSDVIGVLVMEKLKALDEVAYIRFASVYRRFKDAGEFKQELERM